MLYPMGKILKIIAQRRTSFVSTPQLQMHLKMEPCIRKQTHAKQSQVKTCIQVPMLSLPTPSTLPPSQPTSPKGVEDNLQQSSRKWLKGSCK